MRARACVARARPPKPAALPRGWGGSREKAGQGKLRGPLAARRRPEPTNGRGVRVCAAKIKVYDLRNKRQGDLDRQLAELKTELAQLRVAKVTGGAASKLAKIKVVRKSIARVLTVMHQGQKAELRKYYASKKYAPLDLRPKKTRAIRKRLTKHQAAKKTTRQAKKDAHFPLRKYAVKA